MKAEEVEAAFLFSNMFSWQRPGVFGIIVAPPGTNDREGQIRLQNAHGDTRNDAELYLDDHRRQWAVTMHQTRRINTLVRILGHNKAFHLRLPQDYTCLGAADAAKSWHEASQNVLLAASTFEKHKELAGSAGEIGKAMALSGTKRKKALADLGVVPAKHDHDEADKMMRALESTMAAGARKGQQLYDKTVGHVATEIKRLKDKFKHSHNGEGDGQVVHCEDIHVGDGLTTSIRAKDRRGHTFKYTRDKRNGTKKPALQLCGRDALKRLQPGSLNRGVAAVSNKFAADKQDGTPSDFPQGKYFIDVWGTNNTDWRLLDATEFAYEEGVSTEQTQVFVKQTASVFGICMRPPTTMKEEVILNPCAPFELDGPPATPAKLLPDIEYEWKNNELYKKVASELYARTLGLPWAQTTEYDTDLEYVPLSSWCPTRTRALAGGWRGGLLRL